MNAPMIREADFARDADGVRTLLKAYAAWLDFDLCFQGFGKELDQLGSVYGAPHGRFFVAEMQGQLVGCVGLKHLGDGAGEIKRLYVTAACQGHGAGARLLDAVIDAARADGLQRVVLDAAPRTDAAQHLYLRAGFVETAPYYASQIPGTRYFALMLSDTSGNTSY